MGEHEGYKYPHAYPGGFVVQRYLPEGVEGGWFQPRGQGYEREVMKRLAEWWRERGE